MADPNHLSQDDINALIAGGSIERSEEDDAVEPVSAEPPTLVSSEPPVGGEPAVKVINVTGMNIEDFVPADDEDDDEAGAQPAAPVKAEVEVTDDPPGPPPPPPPPEPEPTPEPVAAAVDLEPVNARIQELEQALAESNATVEQVKQEFQTVLEQISVLAKSVENTTKSAEDTNRGLKATPSYRVRETFACGQCQSEKNLATPIKCTSCGKMNWWGWWPKEEEKHELEEISGD